MWLATFSTLVVVLPFLMSPVECISRRCFSCRSRGDLGDCRDPFHLSSVSQPNSTTVVAVEAKREGVETPPCSSGWCSKVLENVEKSSFQEEKDFGIATQRDCLQRPPSDGQERCAYVMLHRKRVYMCICKGDLCNKSTSTTANAFIVVGIFTILATVQKFMF